MTCIVGCIFCKDSVFFLNGGLLFHNIFFHFFCGRAKRNQKEIPAQKKEARAGLLLLYSLLQIWETNSLSLITDYLETEICA